MRTLVPITLFLAVAVLPASAQPANYDSIADNIVQQSLAVQPGEIVVINGGPSEVDLMGALQVAVAKAGGEPILQLSIPEANKRALLETPMEHLQRTRTAGLLMTRMADAFINVSSTQDPGLFSDVPEDRLTATRKAGVPLNQAFNVSNFRSVSLGQTGGIPSEAYAAAQGADYNTMRTMFWRSLDVSPEELAGNARQITSLLTPGSDVRLTSDAGTDLSFKLAASAPKINAGRTGDVIQASGSANVWLPAGEAYVAVDNSSASGTLVVPSTRFRGESVSNLRLTFRNGTVTNMTADSNVDKMRAFLDASDSKAKHLSLLDVGINPHSKPIEGSTYYSWEMGGMVSVGIGNNTWTGGDNNSDAALTFHVADATLSVNGMRIVENGELKFSSIAVE